MLELEDYQLDDKGLALPYWVADDEVIAIISDCTQCLKADVKDIIDCYHMLLREAALKGFRIAIPRVGCIYNEVVERTGLSNPRDNTPLDSFECNRPAFAFANAFRLEMRDRTRNNLYEFKEEGGYSWKADALEELGEVGVES